MLSGIAGQLGIDQSLIYIFFIILIFHFLFSTFYLKPFQNILEIRKKRTLGVRLEAEELKRKAETRFEEYQKKIREVQEQTKALYKKEQIAARELEKSKISAAQQKAKEQLQVLEKTLLSQKQELEKTLEAELRTLVNQMMLKLVKKETL